MMRPENKRFQWGISASVLLHVTFLFIIAGFTGGVAAPEKPQEQVFAVEWIGNNSGAGGGDGNAVGQVAAYSRAETPLDRNAVVDEKRTTDSSVRKTHANENENPAANPAAGQNGFTAGGGTGSGGGTGGSGTGSQGGDGDEKALGAVGGNGPSVMEHPAVPPRLTKHVPPAYPEAARRAAQTGTVLLRLLVSANGRVRDVVVVRSSGYAALDEAASEAAERWRFSSAKDGRNFDVACYITVPVSFTLE